MRTSFSLGRERKRPVRQELPMRKFELMGHRGACGLRPENTLPSFEFALDVGVDSIETDVHLTADGVPIICHEPFLDVRLCHRVNRDVPSLKDRPLLSQLSLAQVRGYRADGNLDPKRFPQQRPIITPLAQLLAAERGIHPFAIPTVADLFALVKAYAGPSGKKAGKTSAQQRHARKVILDFELKRVPFQPELVGDDYRGRGPGLMERQLLEEIHQADMLSRARVRSFDHRALAGIKSLEPKLTTAVLIWHAAPVSPGDIARSVGAELYCPDYRFVDEEMVSLAHAAGIRVIPWTVNDEADWQRLKDWGVDGIATDYPDLFSKYSSRSA
jgi:glycerophosphoryl diester phosphodiesterase